MSAIICSICLDHLCNNEDQGSDKLALNCGHIFHKSCVMRWCQENSVCPCCKAPTTLRNAIRIYPTCDTDSTVCAEGTVSVSSNEVVVNVPPKPTLAMPTWAEARYGAFPDGALKAGSDCGNDLYVARANHQGGVIPGKLCPARGLCYIPWGRREFKKELYEVLVIPESRVRWVPARDGYIVSNAILGGYSESGENLYIGRTSHSGALTLGKIHPSHRVLYIPHGGKEHCYSRYEILVLLNESDPTPMEMLPPAEMFQFHESVPERLYQQLRNSVTNFLRLY